MPLSSWSDTREPLTDIDLSAFSKFVMAKLELYSKWLNSGSLVIIFTVPAIAFPP